jgi:hypothetical protein
MHKDHNNSIFQTLLILCLSLVLLLVQTNRLHIHIDHAEQSGSAEPAVYNPAVYNHVINVHAASIQHDLDFTNHHAENHHAAVDVSPDIKKANLLEPLTLFFLFIGFFLIIPRLTCIRRQRFNKAHNPLYYYLLHPPLRAPPAK